VDQVRFRLLSRSTSIYVAWLLYTYQHYTNPYLVFLNAVTCSMLNLSDQLDFLRFRLTIYGGRAFA